jgi:hypothetical protein
LDCGGKSSRRRFRFTILGTIEKKRRREDLPPQSKSSLDGKQMLESWTTVSSNLKERCDEDE